MKPAVHYHHDPASLAYAMERLKIWRKHHRECPTITTRRYIDKWQKKCAVLRTAAFFDEHL